MNTPIYDRALALSILDKNLSLEGYDRFYFGAEFCSWAMPGKREILRARQLARHAGVAFTLMTPVLREETVAELADLFAMLAEDWQPTDEILISDFGTLEPAGLHLPQATIILGRALSGQKRGPRIEGLSLSEEAVAYFQGGSWYGKEAVRLLAEIGIARIELDNLLQGVAPLPGDVKGSLHVPWLLVTSSRNCPYHRDKSGRRCSVGCGEGFRLTTPQTPHPLLQAGNSQFIENRRLPENLAQLGVDRLVEHRHLPR